MDVSRSKHVSMFSIHINWSSFPLQKLVITDDVVRIFRNYLILSSLSDSIAQVSNCVTGV